MCRGTIFQGVYAYFAGIIICLLLFSNSGVAGTSTVDYSGWSNPTVSGQQDVSWSFDLAGLGLDGAGVVINSASIEIWATGVDASVPPDFWDGNKHYHYYLGSGLTDLSDPIHVEAAASSTFSLAEGDGVTTIPLSDELADGYSYLRDGAFDVSINVYETDTWWDILDYIQHGKYYYLRRPRWDGSLTLVNSRFTVAYVGEPGIIPAPGAIVLGSIGISLVGWLRRRRAL